MKQRVVIVCIICLLGISGCMEPVSPDVATSVGTPEPVLEAASPTVIVPSPATDTFLAPTLAATSTPAAIVDLCVVSRPGIAKSDLEGRLVLEHFWWDGPITADSITTAFLYDFAANDLLMVNVPGELMKAVGVSPGRQHLLYVYDSGTDDENRLAVTDYAGKVISDFDNRVLPESWWDYYQWQTNDTLRVVVLDLGNRRTLPRLYNITTEDYMPLKTDWPYVYKGENLDWGLDGEAIRFSSSDGANIVYDPAITRVVYPKRGQTVSLTDVETGQELASIELPLWGRLPRWSPDGQNLVLIASMDPKAAPGHDEFFIVSRDGPEFKRLTHLTEKLETAHISEYAWSPDGSQIAFWLNTEADDPTLEGTQSELAILDVASGEITKLCIQGISAPIRSDPMPLMTRTQPIWSPDGRQVVFTQLNPSLANTYDVLVLDLETKTALKIASNKQPVGWMINAPGPSAP